jgi:hypothetical protein
LGSCLSTSSKLGDEDPPGVPRSVNSIASAVLEKRGVLEASAPWWQIGRMQDGQKPQEEEVCGKGMEFMRFRQKGISRPGSPSTAGLQHFLPEICIQCWPALAHCRDGATEAKDKGSPVHPLPAEINMAVHRATLCMPSGRKWSLSKTPPRARYVTVMLQAWAMLCRADCRYNDATVTGQQVAGHCVALALHLIPCYPAPWKVVLQIDVLALGSPPSSSSNYW